MAGSRNQYGPSDTASRSIPPSTRRIACPGRLSDRNHPCIDACRTTGSDHARPRFASIERPSQELTDFAPPASPFASGLCHFVGSQARRVRLPLCRAGGARRLRVHHGGRQARSESSAGVPVHSESCVAAAINRPFGKDSTARSTPKGKLADTGSTCDHGPRTTSVRAIRREGSAPSARAWR